MRKPILIFILLLLTLGLKSQDFGIWYDLNAKYTVQRFEFKITNILRTNENAHNINTAYMESEVIYNFSPYLSAGIGYKYIIDPKEVGDLWIYDVIGKIPMKQFSGELRYRSEFNKNIFVSRCRAKLNYNVKSFKPYVSSELFIFYEPTAVPNKWRHIVGVEYKLNKHNAPAIEYIRYENLFGIDLNILSLKYTLKF